MKLATLRDGTRDGMLVVVSRDLQTACAAEGITPTMQHALENWDQIAPSLRDIYIRLNDNAATKAFAFDPRRVMAPLPRAYQWIDGSGYRHHGELDDEGLRHRKQDRFSLGRTADVSGLLGRDAWAVRRYRGRRRNLGALISKAK